MSVLTDLFISPGLFFYAFFMGQDLGQICPKKHSVPKFMGQDFSCPIFFIFLSHAKNLDKI